jgi:hypothetical protein
VMGVGSWGRGEVKLSTVCRVVKGVGMGVILSIQEAAFVRESSQENPRNDAVAGRPLMWSAKCFV